MVDTAKAGGVPSRTPLIRVLILEDNPLDAKLLAALLESSGYNVQSAVVDTVEYFREQLEANEYDIILADFNLRNWTALDALEILKASDKDIPLIVATGTLGDEAAAECIKQGAADFILKDRPARLPAAIERALEDKRLRDEKKQAEEDLRESHGRFRAVFENGGMGMALVDLEGHPLQANPMLRQMLGYSEEELSHMAFTEFTHPDDREADWRAFAELMAGKRGKYELEKRYIHKDGHLVWGLLTVSLVKGSQGRSICAVGVVQDITERKRAEEALRESEERFRGLVENATVGIYRTTPQGQIVMANPALVKMLGYANFEELAARNLEEQGFEPGYPRQTFRERVEQSGELKGTETAWTKPDGSTIFVRESARAVRGESGNVLYYDGIVEDITERKQAEEALRLAQFSVEHASDAIHWMDSQGRIVYANEATWRSLEYSREELLSLSIPDIDPFYPKEVWEQFWQRVKHRGSLTLESQHRAKTGRMFPVEITANYQNYGGKEYIFAFARDITERKRAEAEHVRLVTAIEQSAEAVLITNIRGEIEYVNPAFTRITGYGREEVLGKNPRILKSDKQDPSFYQELWTTILDGKTWEGELVNRRKDGSLYTDHMNIAPIRDEGGGVTHFIATKQDVTEHKALEVHLRQVTKMEAIGRLAGGVAHDFNNLLTIINGYAELLLERFIADTSTSAYLTEVKGAGERAASLTRQLLAFSRRQVLAPQVLDLNAVVSNLEKMLRRLIGEDIELRTALDPALGQVKADPGQIEQVLMNLAVNARDAMPLGGKLIIESSNVDLDATYARNHIAVKPGPFVLLAVSDTGVGMTPEVKAHIFEPFFTTKEEGKGTGLGLATVYGIVKQSGGSIWVYSEPGQGTVFKVYLPAVVAGLTAEAADVEMDTAAGTETILVVEDEAGVRSLIRLALEPHGYKVLETDNAETALKTCGEYEGPIDLLLADVIMPGLSGPLTAAKVMSMRRSIKVLYMSGYTDEAVVHHGIVHGMPFIQKPFSPAALRKKVREVLGRK